MANNANSGRNVLIAFVAAAAIGGAAFMFMDSTPAGATQVMVYKNPTCGCCSKWADHMKAAGYAVKEKSVNDMAAIKEQYGTPWKLESCHTALIDGYVIEGHVPAGDVNRLLAERPDAMGLAVAGMRAGSPGMEGQYSDPYDVILFRADGSTEVYARY